MVKEVSDKVIVSLVVLAILVSLIGTYFVYTNTSSVIENKQPEIQPQSTTGVGYVGLVVVVPEEEGADNG